MQIWIVPIVLFEELVEFAPVMVSAKDSGLRSMIKRRAYEVGIAAPSIHSFRRAFALEMLRGGADLLTLQRLLGHADLTVLRRYVKQNSDDLRAVHAAHSPADNAGWLLRSVLPAF